MKEFSVKEEISVKATRRAKQVIFEAVDDFVINLLNKLGWKQRTDISDGREYGKAAKSAYNDNNKQSLFVLNESNNLKNLGWNDLSP